MKLFISFFFLLFFTETAFSQIKRLNSWNIRVLDKELALSTAISNSTLLMLNGPVVANTLLVSKQCEPFTLSLAQKKVKEWGGNIKTLKIHKAQKFISYVPKKSKGNPTDSLVWVSTNGDCLIANTDRLTKKKYRSLNRRVSRIVN